MNRDPLGEEGGINLYGFVENDPVNWVDPWGLSVVDYLRQKARERERQKKEYQSSDEYKNWQRFRDDNIRQHEDRIKIVRKERAQEIEFAGCVLECLLRETPELISTGVIIPLMFKSALSTSGVGAVGVVAFNVVSNASTANDAYNALQECSDECKQCK